MFGEKGIKEAYRVLRKGGQFAMTSWYDENMELNGLNSEALSRALGNKLTIVSSF
jgi:ubiquinone/menaquinone biosynthesis C-methylase UbiE